jgi:hypothetical protein
MKKKLGKSKKVQADILVDKGKTASFRVQMLKEKNTGFVIIVTFLSSAGNIISQVTVPADQISQFAI